MDNLSASKTPVIRTWAKKHKMKLCFMPTNASWANPKRNSGRCAPLSWADLTIPVTQRWPGACRATWPGVTPTPATPDVLAAQCRERAHIRSERQQRWAGRGPKPRDQNRRTFMDTPLASGDQRGDRTQRELIRQDAEPGHRSIGHAGYHGVVPERLARGRVGQVHLDQRRGAHRQRVPQSV
jgi:hypothetical protein